MLLHFFLIIINEKVNSTKRQHQVLKIICDTYQMCLSEYIIQQALVEAMRFDIEEGNFCDALLEKIGREDGKKDNSSPWSSSASIAPSLTNSDLDMLKKLHTCIFFRSELLLFPNCVLINYVGHIT
jgi:hypothetical protein